MRGLYGMVHGCATLQYPLLCPCCTQLTFMVILYGNNVQVMHL